MSFKIDTRQFQRAVEFSVRDVGRDLPDVLNRSGRNVALSMIAKTPKASAAKIRALGNDVIAAAVAGRLRKAGRLKSTKGDQFKKLVKMEKARRLRAIGYTAGPGWYKAARAFGAKMRMRVQQDFAKSEASKGFGRKAKANRLVAELVNTAPAAEMIGKPALQEAINEQAADLVIYGQRKLAKTLKKYSG